MSHPISFPFVFITSILLPLIIILYRKSIKSEHVSNHNEKTSNVLNHNEKTSIFQTPIPARTDITPQTLNDAIPYRPFKGGKQFVTMGLKKFDWDDWFEMDKNFVWYHDTKAAALEENFHAHVKCLDTPRLHDAAHEVYEELVTFLTHRYPKIFTLEDCMVCNALTGERLKYPADDPQTALKHSALLVQDDLILMAPEEDGQYHLDAGAVCLPGFWRLNDKFCMSLNTLHMSADVPHYQTRLQKSMNRFFHSLTPDKPVTRHNYFIQIDNGLRWSYKIGNEYGTEAISFSNPSPTPLQLSDLYFRSERQTLRRLPCSGVLLFTVRTYFEPITKIAKERGVAGRLAEAIRGWDEKVAEYKGRKCWEEILLKYLDEQAREQGYEHTEGEEGESEESDEKEM